MDHAAFEKIFHQEETYFWRVGRREILANALRRNLGEPCGSLEILDVGCGTGENIRILGPYGRVTGLDISEDAFHFAQERGFIRLVRGSAAALPFPDASFDLVSSLDVMEHIPDDKAALGEVFRVLKPGGTFLITVPAHRWLWSRHDEYFHHVRRYSRADIRSKLLRTGFLIAEWSHFVMPAVPFNFLRTVIDRIVPPSGGPPTSYDIDFSPLMNAFFLFLLRFEKKCIRLFPLPFGSSLFFVAQKGI